MAMATNQFIVIKHSNKSHLQEHMSTFITAHTLEAAGSKDICGKLKCKFFLFPGYKWRTCWHTHCSLLHLLTFFIWIAVLSQRENFIQFVGVMRTISYRHRHCYKYTWSISDPEMVLRPSDVDKTLHQATGLDPYFQPLLHTERKLT